MKPILAAHQIGQEAIFDLGRSLPTIAIRDQQIRATMLARALPNWLTEYYQYETDLPILVVGAGIAGSSVAAELAALNCSVCLIDSDKRPFRLQRRCQSRWICPVQYDWPMRHFGDGKIPWNTIHAPLWLSWQAGRANRVATSQWLPRFAQLASSARVNYQPAHLFAGASTMIRASGAPAGLDVELSDLDSGITYHSHFCAVVLCVGAGRENVALAGGSYFVGFPFWATDPFEQQAFGANCFQKGKKLPVVISGGGDGGVQDLIRIATCQKSAISVFRSLHIDPTHLLMDKLHDADRQAERALAWGESDLRGAYWRMLDEISKETVNDLLTRDPNLRHRLRQLVGARASEITFVVREDHLTCNYLFNRFLAWMLIECLNDVIEYLPSSNIRAIDLAPGQQPLYNPTPTDCLNRNWDVTINTSTNQRIIRTSVVVLRHGITPPLLGVGARQRTLPQPLPPSYLLH